MTKRLKRLHRVCNKNVRIRHGLRHNRARCAIGKGLVYEQMPIGLCTLQRKKEVAFADFTGIKRNARNVKMPRSCPASCRQQILECP